MYVSVSSYLVGPGSLYNVSTVRIPVQSAHGIVPAYFTIIVCGAGAPGLDSFDAGAHAAK